MDDREAVARAYNAVRRTGALDYPAWCAAVKTYCDRHPGVTELGAGPEVARLIAEAAAYLPEITWDGVGGGPVKRYKPDAYIWE